MPCRVNGSRSPSIRAPSARSASSTVPIGRSRARGSPSKRTGPSASAATGGTKRMTVPASPQSTVAAAAQAVVRADRHVLAVDRDRDAEGAQRADHQRGVAGGQRAGDGRRVRRRAPRAPGRGWSPTSSRARRPGRGRDRRRRARARVLTVARPQHRAGSRRGRSMRVAAPQRVPGVQHGGLPRSECSKPHADSPSHLDPRSPVPGPRSRATVRRSWLRNCRCAVRRWTHVWPLLLDEGAHRSRGRVPRRRRDRRGESSPTSTSRPPSIITVVERHPRDDEGNPDPGPRRADRCAPSAGGLVPSWSKDPRPARA